MAGLGPTLGQKGVEDAPDLAVIGRDEALLRKDQAQPAVRADIFDLGQAIVPQRGPAPQLYAQEVLVFSD